MVEPGRATIARRSDERRDHRADDRNGIKRPQVGAEFPPRRPRLRALPNGLLAVFQALGDTWPELADKIEKPLDGMMLDECARHVCDVVSGAKDVDDRQDVVLFPALAPRRIGAHGDALRDSYERRLLHRESVDEGRRRAAAPRRGELARTVTPCAIATSGGFSTGKS